MIRGIMMLFALAILAGCKSDCDEDALYAFIQKDVKAQLKSPGSAVFPPIEEITAVKHELICNVVFNGYVDSQNSFGALIRSYYAGEALIASDGNPMGYALIDPTR